MIPPPDTPFTRFVFAGAGLFALTVIALACIGGWWAIWQTFPYGLIAVPWIGGTTAILLACIRSRTWER